MRAPTGTPGGIEPARLRLTLDLDLAGETVAGVVGDGDGAGEPFTGWVGLTRSIELAIEAHRRPDANQPGRER